MWWARSIRTWALLFGFALVIAFLVPAGASALQSEDGGSAPDLTNEQLRVATKPLEPFVFLDGDRPTGFSIDVWDAVAQRLGTTTVWVPQASVSDIIESSRVGDVDASIAGISMTLDREAVIDFSYPYYNSGLQIATAQEATGTLSSLWGLVRSGSFLIPLLALLALILVVSHLVWLGERGHDSEDFPYEYRQGIAEALWWSTVSVITGGEAVKDINRGLSRLLAVGWMLVGLFLLAFVTARATSTLTVDALEGSINGLDDLSSASVLTVEDTRAADFLRDNRISFSTVGDVEVALERLAAGQVDAVVYDAPVLAYAIDQEYQSVLQLAGGQFAPDPYAIVLPDNSELREAINTVLVEMSTDGSLDSIHQEWFGTGRS